MGESPSDDVLDDMEVALAGLKEELTKLQTALESRFEREMEEEYGG